MRIMNNMYIFGYGDSLRFLGFEIAFSIPAKRSCRRARAFNQFSDYRLPGSHIVLPKTNSGDGKKHGAGQMPNDGQAKTRDG